MRDRVLVWGFSNNRAGTEHVIHSIASALPEVPFDFLCYSAPVNYSDLFGPVSNNRSFTIPIKIKHPFAYGQQLRHFMNRHAFEYNALWMNINEASNIDILKMAAKMGVPRRIVHSHSSSLPDVAITRTAHNFNRSKCVKLATDRWACSPASGEFMFGERDFTVLPNCVDSNALAYSAIDRSRIRTEWDIPEDARLIGTVGRLVDVKRPSFLIQMLASLIESGSDCYLMFVGDGPLRADLVGLATKLGVDGKVRFVGSQERVAPFLSAFDVFALPSHFEGLSVALLEAQFNGLPCVVSDAIVVESIISRDVRRIACDDSDSWIMALASASRREDSLIKELASKYDSTIQMPMIRKLFL